MNKINKFYIFLVVIVLILLGTLLYSIRTVFQSYMISKEIQTGEKLTTIDQNKLEEVYNWSFERKSVSLNIEEENIQEDDAAQSDQNEEE